MYIFSVQNVIIMKTEVLKKRKKEKGNVCAEEDKIGKRSTKEGI